MSVTIGARPRAATRFPDRSEFVLWACIGLFFARVVAQVEVLLLAPTWLPEMSAWYSGLLPYPILLPLQIALLMLMCVLALRTRMKRPGTTGTSGGVAGVWRALAILYFVAMTVRLAVSVNRHGREFYLNGAIPIAFHWVLALFAVVCTRRGCARAASVSRRTPGSD